MSDQSNIEWTDASWNPTSGCSRVSPGCENCYAELDAHRMGSNPNPKIRAKYEGLTVIGQGKTRPRFNGVVRPSPGDLAKPLRWRKPRKVFVNSNSDLFHERLVETEEGRRHIAAVFAVMAACPHLTFQLLTKRPEQAERWFAWLDEQVDDFITRQVERGEPWPTSGLARAKILKECLRLRGHLKKSEENKAAKLGHMWPLPNVIFGVTVENQKYADERLDVLEQIVQDGHTAVTMVSYEPALGPVDFSRWLTRRAVGTSFAHGVRDGALDLATKPRHTYATPTIGWLIAGGESGGGARPMHPGWARAARDQCTAAGVPFFFKQFGEWAPDSVPNRGPKLVMSSNGSIEKLGRYGRDSIQLLEDITVNGSPPLDGHPDRVVLARLGKGTAGRMLDGRTWDEFPEAA